MIRKVLSTALVSAAVVLAGPALAAPGGGGGGGQGGGVGAGASGVGHGGMGGAMGIGGGFGASGSMRGGMSGSFDTMSGTATRINRASPNSSFNRTTTTSGTTLTTRANSRIAVSSSSLPGLTTGLTVQTSTGTTLGTVSRVITDRNGNILQVFVTTSTGRTLRLAPTTLSMNGTTLVTSAITNRAVNSQGIFHASPTGIANASPNSVLARGAVSSTATALAGLATNMTVQNANGTNIGTVSRIVTDRAGNVRLVIVTNTTTGQTFRLSPTTLTVNGTTLMTSSTVGG